MRSLPALARPLAALLVVLVATVAACAPGSTAPSGTVTVSGAWARSAPTGGTSAAYLEIHNGSPAGVSLTGAMSDVTSHGHAP